MNINQKKLFLNKIITSKYDLKINYLLCDYDYIIKFDTIFENNILYYIEFIIKDNIYYINFNYHEINNNPDEYILIKIISRYFENEGFEFIMDDYNNKYIMSACKILYKCTCPYCIFEYLFLHFILEMQRDYYNLMRKCKFHIDSKNKIIYFDKLDNYQNI